MLGVQADERQQLAGALVIGLAERDARLNLGNLGPVDRLVEGRDRIAGGNRHTLFGVHLDDPARDLGAHQDRFVGPQRADRGN